MLISGGQTQERKMTDDIKKNKDRRKAKRTGEKNKKQKILAFHLESF